MRSRVVPEDDLGDARGLARALDLERQLHRHLRAARDVLSTELREGLEQMARDGYVAVHEAGASRRHLEALESLAAAGELPIRVYAMLSLRDEDLIRQWIDLFPVPRNPSLPLTPAAKPFHAAADCTRGARLPTARRRTTRRERSGVRTR